MSTAATKLLDADPIMEHLEDQITWYDRESQVNQQAYKRVKIVVRP